MKLLKVKTARFRNVVEQCGEPESVTLWSEPKKDRAFQKALREERVMSVHQSASAAQKDWGEVGFLKGPHIGLLIFPRPLSAFGGRRIVGIDYNLLKKPELAPLPRRKVKAASSASQPPSDAPKKGGAPQFTVIPGEEGGRTPEHPPIDPFMLAAINEARKGLAEGGIPIGSALVRHGELVATGHNKRVQENDPVTHAETDCLRNAGRLGSFRGCTLYSTLMPCYFCAGAAVQFGIRRVIVGESRNFPGAPEFMRSHGIEVIDLDLPECYEMMKEFIRRHPKLWHEDIGVD